MPLALVAVAGVAGAAIAADAAGDAADQQSESAQEGIDVQNSQFEQVQELLSPYVDAGESTLASQLDILGANGQQAQQSALSGIENSSQFNDIVRQGENSILQNASATGGLRGGNTQTALAQFRPQMLSQLIDQQYARLGGVTSMGQNAAAGVGNAGMQTGNNVSNLIQQQGAAQAGGSIAQGNAIQGGINNIAGGIGAYQGYQQPAVVPTAPVLGGQAPQVWDF